MSADGEAPHPRIARLIEHWRALAPGPGLLPGRQHFDPMQVRDLLPHLWLLDVVAGPPRRFRFRLVGGAIVDAGAPVRVGMMVEPSSETARNYDTVVDTRAPGWR